MGFGIRINRRRVLPIVLSIAFLGMVSQIAFGVEPATSEPSTVPSTQASTNGRDADLAQARAHWVLLKENFAKKQFDRALTEVQAALKLYRKVYGDQDNADIAMCITAEGGCLTRLNRNEEALADYQASTQMYERLYKNQDRLEIAIGKGNVGWALFCLGRDDDALPYLQASLEMNLRIQKGKDEINLAVQMQNLALCFDSMERYEEALPLYKSSLEMHRRLLGEKEPLTLAQDEDAVAFCLKNLGRSAEALPIYQEELELRRKLAHGRDNRAFAQTEEDVGGCLDDLGRSDEALPLYNAVLAMRQRMARGANNADIAESYNDLGSCLDFLGRSAEGLSMYEQALRIERELCKGKDDWDLATDMANVAQCKATLGRQTEAMPLFESALLMRQRLSKGKDNSDVAESFDSIANCLDDVGQYEKALPMHWDALQMRGRIYEGRDHPDWAESFDSVANCLACLGRHPQALGMYQSALDMRRRIFGKQDHPSLSLSMNSVAIELGLLGRVKDALPISQGSVEMAKRLKSPFLFRYSSVLGVLLMRNGDVAGAAKAFEESIDALEQERIQLGGDDQDRMGFMNANQGWDPFSGMVRAQLALNHADSAAEYLDRGRAKSLLDYLERGERMTGGDLLGPAEKKAQLANDVKKLEVIKNTRHMMAMGEHVVLEARALMNRARAMNNEQGLAQIKLIQPKYEEACQLYEGAKRLEFTLAGRTTYTESTTSLQIQSLVQPNQHLLMYSLTSYDAVVLVIPPPGQPITGVRLTQADGKSRLSGRALAQLIGKYRRAVVQRGMNSVRGLRPVSDDTNATTQPAEDVAKEGYQLFRELMPEEVWKQIQDDKLVYVIPDPSMSGLPLEMLIVQTPTGAEARDNVYWLDKGPLLSYGPSAAALLTLRRQEGDRGKKTYAHEAVLLGDPVLQRKAVDTNRVSPPMAGAFVKSVQSGSTAEAIGLRNGAVIVGYGPISITSGGQFNDAVDKLELLHFHGKLDGTPKLKFWLDGKMFERELSQDSPPGIELTDMTPALAIQLTPHETTPQPVAQVALRNATLTRFGALMPLPGTREEVKGIYQVLTGQPYEARPDDPVVVLLGEDATGPRLEEAAKGARYVHLATHGMVEQGQYAIYSSVVLSQPQVITPQDTGVLTLEDIINHWWGELDGTELVVLSACDSEGLDERGSNSMGGEGVFGLPWGFMYAGSPAVVASLWEVQDASTAELMQKFYRDMQTSPQANKLAAFTAARKQLKKDYPEPFFWSPFIYLGDPN